MNIEKAMIIDIDNCLIDSRDNIPYLPTDPSSREQWNEFQKRSGIYKRNVIVENIVWFNYTVGGFYPFFVTSREDINGVREMTEQIIKDIFKWKVGDDCLLFMRKAYDYRTDVEVKDDLYVEVEMCCDKVVLAMDDRTDICELWQSKGIPTLQFRYGE